MTVGVVYRLKAVEIEVIQHKRQLFRLTDVQDPTEIALVEQAGQTVRVCHVFQLDLLPDILHNLHDHGDRAVRVPLNREDGHHHIGVLRPAAILDFEVVIRFAEHTAQIVRRKQPRKLGVFRIDQRDIAFRDDFDHFRILSGGRIERLIEPQLIIAVASGIQIDDGIPIDDAAHALQETVAFHLFALEVQPLHFLVLKAQPALHPQRQHHDDDGEKTECAEQDERGILHVIQCTVHLIRLDDANE